MKFATQPIPHHQARQLIMDKPAVSRDIYDALPQEMKSRAFTITGIEDFDTVQAVRDEIARLPAGADWDSVKKEIAAKISPWFTPEAAERRAKLLLSHHGFTAYSAASARVADAMTDIFPYRQYLATGDRRVRASHAALDGIVLPAEHPFWQKHTPPWEWNCRCQAVPLTQADAAEETQQDRLRPPDQRRVLGEMESRMLAQGSLLRGPSVRVDVRTPKERGGSYEWSARDASLPYDQLAARWDAPTRQAFETWAESIEMKAGTSLLSHLTGLAPAGGALKTYRASTFAQALTALALQEKDTWTPQDIARLRAALKKADPVLAREKIQSLEGTKLTGVLTGKEVRRTVQDMLDLLPPALATSLPPLRIKLIPHFTDPLTGKKTATAGMYSTGGLLRIATDSLKGLSGPAKRAEMRRILSHELMHWLHLDSRGPQAHAYRAAIRAHYQTRTLAEPLLTAPSGYQFRRDGWWKDYAGKEYTHENGHPAGLEIPTTHFELWEQPELLGELLDNTLNPKASLFRETFALVHSIFDLP